MLLTIVDLAACGLCLQAPGTLFPSFRTSGPAKDLDCFAYHGVFPSLRHCNCVAMCFFSTGQKFQWPGESADLTHSAAAFCGAMGS